jgi:hypothetical protein
VTQHTIAGRNIGMPVRIRRATQHMAMFSVDADAAQAMIDYSGLQVCRHRPGRTVVALVLMHYVDGDLGQYLEYGTNVMVNRPGASATGMKALQAAGAFIHHLPVDQSFTLEAGRSIWGYPKVMAEFVVRDGHHFGFDTIIDGQFAVGMDFAPGLRVPRFLTPGTRTQPTYSHLDGVTRETAGEMTLTGVRYRLGGATVRLGQHPYAKELASLGFPRRAMVSSSADNVEMTFGEAEEIP